jgi:nitrite reductase (NO-forming)
MLTHLILISLIACGGGEEKPAETPAPPPTEAPPPAEAPPAAAPPAAATDFNTLDEAGKKDFLMKLGEKVYTTGGSGGVACMTCHQQTGEGLPPTFPPLKGSKDFMKDCQNHASLIINGLKGEIEVQGTKYNNVMPPQPNLPDDEIAAVITYERLSWGNDYGLCTPDDVKAARAAAPAAQ